MAVAAQPLRSQSLPYSDIPSVWENHVQRRSGYPYSHAQYDLINLAPAEEKTEHSLYPERQFRRYRQGYLDVSQGFRRSGGRRHFTDGERAYGDALCLETTSDAALSVRPDRSVPLNTSYSGKAIAPGHRDSHLTTEDGFLQPKQTAAQYHPSAVICDGLRHGVSTKQLVTRDPAHHRSDNVKGHMAWPASVGTISIGAAPEERPAGRRRGAGIDTCLAESGCSTHVCYDRADADNRPKGGVYDYIARARRVENPHKAAQNAFYQGVRGKKRVSNAAASTASKLW